MTKQLTNVESLTFTYRKGRVFYYSRRVPFDLRDHYSKPRIVQSLRTKSPSIAEKASLILTSRLEEYWLNLRVKKFEVPVAHLLTDIGRNSQSDLPDIRVALDEYLRLKGEVPSRGWEGIFMQANTRSRSADSPILVGHSVPRQMEFPSAVEYSPSGYRY